MQNPKLQTKNIFLLLSQPACLACLASQSFDAKRGRSAFHHAEQSEKTPEPFVSTRLRIAPTHCEDIPQAVSGIFVNPINPYNPNTPFQPPNHPLPSYREYETANLLVAHPLSCSFPN